MNEDMTLFRETILDAPFLVNSIKIIPIQGCISIKLHLQKNTIMLMDVHSGLYLGIDGPSPSLLLRIQYSSFVLFRSPHCLKSSKMSHLWVFSVWAFSSIFCPFKIDLSGKTVCGKNHQNVLFEFWPFHQFFSY